MITALILLREGILVKLLKPQIPIYPNPVATDLHIDLPFDNIKTRISLYSLQGSCIKQMNAYEMSNVMNVSDVAPGLYILNVNAKGVSKSFKIEIKH